MTEVPGFLSDFAPRPWSPLAEHGFREPALFLGKGANALEIAIARAPAPPRRSALLETWRHRRGRRAAPVLLIVLHPGGGALCGATGEKPPIHTDIDAGRLDRLCQELLRQPDRHAALRYLSQALPTLETALPGLKNEGLLALHELEFGVPKHKDWAEAKRKAAGAVGKRDHDLLTALGFRIERIDNLTYLLRGGDQRTALAVMLREDESPEARNDRFNGLSPVSYALNKADVENLSWAVLTQGSRLRLYAADVDAGVGRRGRTETYVECQPSLLAQEQLPYLWLLYSAEALAPDGSLNRILEDSQRYSGELAERLRERIYDRVIPILARGIAAVQDAVASPEELARTYEMALTVLFRLLFIAYAEDRDLLPYRTNDAYRRRSLKQKALELAGHVTKGISIASGDNHWREAEALWRAVAAGNPEWGVPAYDGGLFTDDPDVSASGAGLAAITLPNEIFEAALRHLLVIETEEGGLGPVDFRSLGVREFGTIYEGLLESELARADTNLALEENGTYRLARGGEAATVAEGEIYLHNKSGARKSSGSYYTKPFAVEHLLDGALEPALDDHFERLNSMDETDAAAAFFDFRVADIAMGSGHFLIGAIDRIEKRMADYLARRNLTGVMRELAVLRAVAEKTVEDSARLVIEDGQLLRRQIARRCIYGVDLNALSVQLARLSVWIHTFVPGLPLSFLDHNLVHGNALVGVGTFKELREVMLERSLPLFATDAESLLGAAKKPLQRLANLNDATLPDVAAAREAEREAQDALRDTAALFDLVTALPISDDPCAVGLSLEKWGLMGSSAQTHLDIGAARRALHGLQVLHFPAAFPEVFLRDRSGFDVILGNPPWQEATVEELAFWARHFPGLRGLSPGEQKMEMERLRAERTDLVAIWEDEREEAERMRTALVGGNYPGMGTGDPDLYKAFCWRFWRLSTADGGRIGVVLPRSALAAKGSTNFRRTAFEHAASVDVTMLLNNLQWVFPEVHPQYSIGLVCIARGTPTEESIGLRGPYASDEAFREGIKLPCAAFNGEDVLAWNDTASLPLLLDPESVEVFAQLRKAPRLDLNEISGGGAGEVARSSRPGDGRDPATGVHDLRQAGQWWRARPDTELHATNQQHLMTFENKDHSEGLWPVYKGASFNIWTPDTGVYFAQADPEPVLEWLQRKRENARGNSPHREFPLEYLSDRSTLPCFAPRIAFRDVTNRTNQRTVIACLVPPRVFLTNKGPYFLWPRGDEKDQAFLLGILCSIPLDWYARRFVETNVNFFIINPFPIPRPSRDDARWRRVVELAGRLACPDDRFATWAEAVGVSHGQLTADDKDNMIHELDAVAACLYGLSEQQLVHIHQTFHEGWDYGARLDGTLKHFHAWGRR